ncbi:Solute carrier family 26 member 6 [Nibea albiflora]|uniref:Solute carrier family 26 member 6 n=1 Tax=Nibea albiflora TaxID=240163 RepID=A0ACB7EZS5_NIBAL|nr:Solute carrier family 26 member 6 [Nibea albiflora]
MDSTRRFGKYKVEREVLDEQRLKEVTKRKSYSETHPSLTERLKASLRCTVPKLKKTVVSSLPVLYWLPKYSVWDYGMPDLISGISVGIMHLPQGMAYALLASLPPVFGLYTSLYPALIYIFFGTSRHNSIGTFTVLSIMVGSVTERLAPDVDFLKINGTNVTAEVDIIARDSYRVQVAAATTVLGGLIQVVLGMVKFGFVGTYLSEPLVRAYTTAAAVHAVVAQLKYIFGVSPDANKWSFVTGVCEYCQTLKNVCSLLPDTHLPTLVVSAVSMVFLIAAKELNSFLSPKLPVPIPVELITELVALGLSNTVGGFFQCYSVCASMSRSLIQETTGGKTQMAGVASALIVLVTILKLGPLFQELPKAVLASIVFVNLKGMFKQYSDIVTLWKSSKIDLVVWLVTWVSTLLFNLDLGLAASISFALLTVIFRTQLPTYSVLGNVPGTELYVDIETHREAREIPGVTIFRSSATVYFANADLYLEALKEKSGLDISKMIIYKRRQEAKQKRRERRAERRAKRQAKRERRAQRAAKQLSAAPVFSVEEEAGRWGDTCMDGDATDNEEQDWTERENGTVFVIPTTPQTPDGHCRWEYLKGGDPDCTSLGWMSDMQDGDTTTLGSSSEDTLSHDLERVSLGSLGKWTWDIHSIIIDLSTANFIDTVAIKMMKNIFQDFSEIDVDIYMAGCQTSVVEQLERGDFFSESITKRRLFASVHDAVLYCLDHRGATSSPRHERSVVSLCS